MALDGEEQEPSRSEYEAHFCWENVDRNSDAETTSFKRRARLHQARWREARGLPAGHEPMQPRPDKAQRPLGSRIDYDTAIKSGVNFLGTLVLLAAQARVAQPEHREMLKQDRLFADLLSSMPMCFNLFGWSWGDRQELARIAEILVQASVQHSGPIATPGHASSLCFEWSPGRFDPGYLGSGTAFDAAFLFGPDDGPTGIVGVETKYHEHCSAQRRPAGEKVRHYLAISAESGVFKPGAVDKILGSDLQQVWLDHLLILSMLQHPSRQWSWGRFIIAYPARNPSIRYAVRRYSDMLADQATFGSVTLESLLTAGMLAPSSNRLFSERYLW
jgi:hypothetical protein